MFIIINNLINRYQKKDCTQRSFASYYPNSTDLSQAPTKAKPSLSNLFPEISPSTTSFKADNSFVKTVDDSKLKSVEPEPVKLVSPELPSETQEADDPDDQKTSTKRE